MLEMLQYGFLKNAFLAGGMIALIAPVIGVYIVLRRQSLVAETLSHVSLAGVALGALLGYYPMLTGMVAALFGAMLVDTLRRSFRSYSELSIAILMSGGLATALVLMSMNQGVSRSFTSYLFGSIIAVNATDLMVMAGVLVLCALFFFFLWRPMYVLTFDEETAEVSGIPTRWLSLAFSLLTGLVVAVSMPIVGVLLVSSLMVLPAAIALRLSKGFTLAVVLAVVIGLVGVMSGLTLSFYQDIPPGGTIVLVLIGILIAVLALKRLVLFFQTRFGSKEDAGLLASKTVEER
ncbi:zinc transport system permease protein [Tumebacillus sp. BK434]|uniref:metal ABC transporter permease n=1 Tax=Tumebacillus sp. BK434 TaxID=2512169 RepID=UPI0010CE8FEA|nr:metal ABC transporter permease [Tumebacillus sp. BK434]TCP55907.1 zinc transport system permease protein [Tumebacillus sp. BK434]